MRDYLSNVASAVIAMGFFIIGMNLTGVVPTLVTGIVTVAVGVVAAVATGITWE